MLHPQQTGSLQESFIIPVFAMENHQDYHGYPWLIKIPGLFHHQLSPASLSPLAGNHEEPLHRPWHQRREISVRMDWEKGTFILNWNQ